MATPIQKYGPQGVQFPLFTDKRPKLRAARRAAGAAGAAGLAPLGCLHPPVRGESAALQSPHARGIDLP